MATTNDTVQTYIIILAGDKPPVQVQADSLTTTAETETNTWCIELHRNDKLVGRFYASQVVGWHT